METVDKCTGVIESKKEGAFFLIPEIDISTNQTFHVRDNACNLCIILKVITTHICTRAIKNQSKEGYTFNHTCIVFVDANCWSFKWLRKCFNISMCSRYKTNINCTINTCKTRFKLATCFSSSFHPR